MNAKIISSMILILATVVPATAATVYQWTDAEGVVHFSDVPPADQTITEAQELEYPVYAETIANPEDYSIINQLETMTEWRRQITEERLAQRELELEAKRIANEKHANRYNVIEQGLYYRPQQVYYPSYPVYYPYPHHGGYGHHGGPRPHPGNTPIVNPRPHQSFVNLMN